MTLKTPEIETVAKAMFEARHKKLSNCFQWDDADLDGEHPDCRPSLYRDARAAILALDRLRGDADELSAAKARIALLEEALRPFADFANRFGELRREDSWELTRNPSGKYNLRMGDVRRARAALETPGTQ